MVLFSDKPDRARGTHTKRIGKRALTVSAISVAMVATGQVAATAGPPAGSIHSTRQQIREVQSEIASTASRVHYLTVQYRETNLRAFTLGQQLRADRQRLAGARRSVARLKRGLLKDALAAYTNSATPGQASAPTSATQLVLQQGYLQFASSDVSDAEGAYALKERQLTQLQSTLAAETSQARNAASQTASARRQALSDASSAQGRLTALEGQLTTLERTAAIKAKAGGPVNGGIVKTVRKVVSGPPPTAPPTSTSTTQPPHKAPPTTAPTTTSAPTTSPPITAPPTTAPPTTAPPTTQPPKKPPPPPGGGSGGVWLELRECESGNNYAENTGNGFYGAYQFSEQTWLGLGLHGYPYQAAPAVQDAAAKKLQSEYGWSPWPACSKTLGL